MTKIKVLHCALEYKKGVGGIKSVTSGLLPALASSNEISLSIVTPFFDVYEGFYDNLEKIGNVKHIFKNEIFTSDVYRAVTDVVNDNPIYHYMIGPGKDSGVAKIFSIGEELNIYKNFPHSNANNRLEFFAGAVASMVRISITDIPEFDVVHAHTWHTGISACIMKEFENLTRFDELIQGDQNALKKVPHIVATVHMLLDVLSGWMRNPNEINNFIQSVGLPESFLRGFPEHSAHMSEQALMRRMFSLVYADAVTTVSQGLKKETLTGKAEGLDKIFKKLNAENRLYGITNGIDHAKYDGTSTQNLGSFALDSQQVSISKLKLKQDLAVRYPSLDPNKMWFLNVGRFAQEKGVDMLPYALDEITKQDAVFIVMGFHVAFKTIAGVETPVYKDQIEYLKKHSNVVIIEDPLEQQEYGKKLRAAADCTLVLSHNEACGLVPMEGMANATITVAPNNQGLPDTVKPLWGKFAVGTGFLYDDSESKRLSQLQAAIQRSHAFYTMTKKIGALDTLLERILAHSKQFDWSANPSQEYLKLYQEIIKRKVLTADRIRTVTPGPMLAQFAQKELQTRKVFQIGFNKCGTSSIFDLFWRNSIHGIHYGFGFPASSMYENLANSKPLISQRYAKFPAFFDIENTYADSPLYMHRLFKELDKQYPGSKFILNTRDKQKWLQSRSTHYDTNEGRYYIDVVQNKLGLDSHDQVRQVWSKEWDEHHKEVKAYFKDRPDSLLVYDIETDPVEKLCHFFKEFYSLEVKELRHINKTPVHHP